MDDLVIMAVSISQALISIATTITTKPFSHANPTTDRRRRNAARFHVEIDSGTPLALRRYLGTVRYMYVSDVSKICRDTAGYACSTDV